MGASVCISPRVQAAEQVTIEYDNTTINVPLVHLQTFALTGQAASEDVQTFFQQHPQLGQIVQNLMLKSIKISPSFAQRVTKGAIGNFVLNQLNQLISDPTRRGDIEPLRTALVESYQDDNEFTLIEVISKYPAPSINLNLTDLQPIYNDVSAFVERIEPALETARAFLQDLICHCPTASATTEIDPAMSLALTDLASDSASTSSCSAAVRFAQSLAANQGQAAVQAMPSDKQPTVQPTIQPNTPSNVGVLVNPDAIAQPIARPASLH
jgi:hypothetical protein